MFGQIIRVLFACSLALASGLGFAQEDNPEAQEMRQIGAQVMQNMVQQGIDPREFFGDVRRQMQDGTFDMSALQQKLVERGLIDKETVTKMQTTAQNTSLNSIRRQLDVTDAEWEALQPKVQRVIIAGSDADSSGQMFRVMATVMRGQSSKSEVAKSRRELQAALASPTTTSEEYQSKLGALRGAIGKAKEELDAAQKDLIAVLTARQEAVLCMLGLL